MWRLFFIDCKICIKCIWENNNFIKTEKFYSVCKEKQTSVSIVLSLAIISLNDENWIE